MNYFKSSRFSQVAFACALSLTLGACGGGGGSESSSANTSGTGTNTSTDNTLTRSGYVSLPARAENALVCVDLKGSGLCDANAPTASRTDNKGKYVIRYTPKDEADAQAFKSAVLLAQIQHPEGKYTLSTPGKSDDINPLTTLVHRQMVEDAATLESAEQKVARLLDIDVSAIYDLRQASIAADAASMANYLLKNDLLIDQEAEDSSAQLVFFRFKDSFNYEYDVHAAQGSANAAGQTHWTPVYGGKVNGNDRTLEDAAYNAHSMNGFPFTRHEDYLKKGLVNLYSADNQFTPILLKRQATAEAAENARKESLKGYQLEKTIRTVDISGQSMATFLGNPEANLPKLPKLTHLQFLDVKDPGIFADAVFPKGSLLHIKLGTEIGNTNSQKLSGTANNSSYVMSKAWKFLEAKWNDLGGYGFMEDQGNMHFSYGLDQGDSIPVMPPTVRYSLNDHAWYGMKAALSIP